MTHEATLFDSSSIYMTMMLSDDSNQHTENKTRHEVLDDKELDYKNDGYRHSYKKELVSYINKYKRNQNDYSILSDLFEKVEALEKEILKEGSPVLPSVQVGNRNAIEEFNYQQTLKEEEARLRKDQADAGKLFIEGVKLATLILSQNNDPKELGAKTKEEINLLHRSLQFILIITKNPHKLVGDELKTVVDLATDINNHLKSINPREAQLKKWNKWLSFAAVFTGVLFLGAMIALTLCATLGAGLALTGVFCLVGFIAFGLCLTFGSMSVYDLNKQPKFHLHRFYQGVEQFAKNKGMLPDQLVAPTLKA